MDPASCDHAADREDDDLFEMIESFDREASLGLGARMQQVYDQLLQTEPRLAACARIVLARGGICSVGRVRV